MICFNLKLDFNFVTFNLLKSPSRRIPQLWLWASIDERQFNISESLALGGWHTVPTMMQLKHLGSRFGRIIIRRTSKAGSTKSSIVQSYKLCCVSVISCQAELYSIH
jgi:hypothetical protein